MMLRVFSSLNDSVILSLLLWLLYNVTVCIEKEKIKL